MVVQLIAKNKQEKLQYEGKCKLMIDAVSKLLLIEPVNEEYKMISAMFKWKFVAQKNILFVFAEYNFQDFALIFDDPKKCNKIHEIMVKKGATPGNNELIHERFLPELFTEISANNESSSKLKEIFIKWIEFFDGKEKKEYIQLLKENDIYDFIFPCIKDSETSNPRKRKAKDCFSKKNKSDKNNEFDAKRSNGNWKKIVEKPNFEIVSYERYNICYKRIIMFFCVENPMNIHGILNAKIIIAVDYNPENYGEKEIVRAENFNIYKEFRNGIDKSKLVIFASSDQSTCYEYFWENQRKKFVCLGCIKNRSHVTAKLCLHEDGSKFVKLSKKKHVCEPREFKPEKFDPSKKAIVESANFRIFKYKNNDVENSRLIVFCETNKNLCYEYYLNKTAQLYHCAYCLAGKKPTATLCQNEDSKDYLILDNAEHICNLLEFNPEKYKDDIIVDKSMYQFISTTMGRYKNKILAIFSTQDKQFYYKFVFTNQRKHYYCSRCDYSNTYITATIQNEGKENECVFMSNQKHICEPFKYSLLVENSIVKFPNFELIKRKFRGNIIQYMVVFTNDDKSECYEYTWNDKLKNFRCYACSRHHKINVFAKIFKNVENEDCVELRTTEHKCKPIKFVAEASTKIVKEPDFELYEIFFRGKNIKKLTIFDSKDKNYGYVYTFIDCKKKYVCPRCTKKCKCVTATIKQQENGRNYVELNKIEHVCEIQKL